MDYEAAKVFNSFTEKQKLYSTYAEQFSKLHHVTQQLSRCNVLLNQNIESMEVLNNMLEIDDRLDPFMWKTSDDWKNSYIQQNALQIQWNLVTYIVVMIKKKILAIKMKRIEYKPTTLKSIYIYLLYDMW